MTMWQKISKGRTQGRTLKDSSRKTRKAAQKGPTLQYLGYIVLIIAIAIRVFAITLPAQPYDIGTYSAWGRLILELGPTEFFASTWCDYLPLPVYLFALISHLSSYFSLSFSIVFKSFFTLIELGLIAVIHSIARRSDLKGLEASSPKSRLKRSDLLVSLLILSPAFIGDTSWWGQTDSLPALLAVISLIYFLRSLRFPYAIRHTLYATLLLSLAVAFKPIVILTLPVFAIILIKSPHRPKFPYLILYTLYAILLFLLPALFVNSTPFGAFRFLLDKTLEQASTYPYTSINAFNLWNIRSPLSSWPPDNHLVLGLTLQSWGQLFFSLLSLNTLRLWARTGWDRSHAPRVIGTILAAFFTFTTRMHERHLLFALPFLALATLTSSWLIVPYMLLTTLFSFNLWAAYSWVLHDQTWPMHIVWGNLASVATTLTTLSLAVFWDWPKAIKEFLAWIKKNRLLPSILIFALFLRLVNLGSPPQHIFDEVYHAFTAQEILSNNLEAWIWWATPPEGFAYEWTHPPVAKYGMVLGLATFGDTAFAWRFFSAILGVVSIYGVYRLTLSLFRSRSTAALAAFLLTIEGLHLVQSRIGMNDIYMLTFFIWSLNYALTKSWKKSAILYGLALASKWSALYGVLPLALIYLRDIKVTNLALASVRNLLLSIRLVLISLCIYLLSYSPFFLSGYTWAQFFELHRQMWYYHTNLVATHAYQSLPWQWIFSLRPVWYFVEYGDKISNIYSQSNPILLWLGLVALILQLPKIKKFPYFILYTLYAILTIPWIFSPRIMFFYHYLPSATFLMIILASWLGTLSSRTRLIIITLALIVFLLISPFYYGFPMPQAYWDTAFSLFPSWK